MTTWRAPTWRAIATAMMPIGPAPVISTSSPTRSKASAVWTALPKRIEDRAELVVDVVGQRHDVERGNAQVFGEGAGNVDADAPRLRVHVKAPAARGAAIHADDVALAGDPLADREAAHVGADRDDLAGVFVADDHRHGNRRCAHSSQL